MHRKSLSSWFLWVQYICDSEKQCHDTSKHDLHYVCTADLIVMSRDSCVFCSTEMAVIGRKLKTHLHTNILILQLQTFKSYWNQVQNRKRMKDRYNILRTISATYLKSVCNIYMFGMDNFASLSLFSQIDSYSTRLSQKSCTRNPCFISRKG